MRQGRAGSTPFPNTFKSVFWELIPFAHRTGALSLSLSELLFHPFSLLLLETLQLSSKCKPSHSFPFQPLSLMGWGSGRTCLICLFGLNMSEFEIIGGFWFHRTSWWFRVKALHCTTATGDKSLKTGFAALWVYCEPNALCFLCFVYVTKTNYLSWGITVWSLQFPKETEVFQVWSSESWWALLLIL